MTIVDAVALFCEDFRQDTNGSFILTGVLSDNISVPKVPGAVPKLGIFARINVPVDWAPEPMKLVLTLPDRTEISIGEFDVEAVASAQATAKSLDAPFTGFLGATVISPLALNQACRVNVQFICGSQSRTIGSLNFQVDSALEN